MQSEINSGGKYRTVSHTFTDEVPLVAHAYASCTCVHILVHARACTRCTYVERKEGNDGRVARKENRTERERGRRA